MRFVTIVGARPQFVKAAAVSRELRKSTEVSEVLVHTGQHYDENMSSVFFEELEIPRPDHALGIGSGSHGVQTGRMLGAIEEVLHEKKADWVLVYGDTNSTLAGALAAAKLHIPVAHVEAKLRSFNRRMPEEINRVLTDHVATLLFAPTEAAVSNLKREGFFDEQIALVGDVMYDASLYYAARAAMNSRIIAGLGLKPKEYILATIHRAENTDDPHRLGAIMAGLRAAADTITVVLPIHPRTKEGLQRYGIGESGSKNLLIIDPVGYLDMMMLEKHASLIATDSGGVQKEAFFHRVPCVTLRDETEWRELVELGWNCLVPPVNADCIKAALLNAAMRNPEPPPKELYGGGHAAQAIIARLKALGNSS